MCYLDETCQYLIKGHIFLLVLLLAPLVLERLHEGLHVALGGRSGGLVPQPKLPDEGPELAGAQGHGEHGERLLELRGLDRAGQISQGHLLTLLASREEVLHLVSKTLLRMSSEYTRH